MRPGSTALIRLDSFKTTPREVGAGNRASTNWGRLHLSISCRPYKPELFILNEMTHAELWLRIAQNWMESSRRGLADRDCGKRSIAALYVYVRSDLVWQYEELYMVEYLKRATN